MTRILFIANGIIGKNPGLSGGDARFLEIARYWLLKKIRVELLSSQTARQISCNFNVELPIHIIPNLSDDSNRFAYVLRTLQSLLYLPQSLNNFNKGIVYSVNDSLFDVISAIRLKLRNRKGITWAAAVHLIPPFPPWKRKKASLLNSILFFINERLSLLLINFFADIVFPISNMTAMQLKKMGMSTRKLYPVKCGVDLMRIRKIAETIKLKKYDAVFMKRVQPVKGAFDLIKIWKEVIKYKRNAKLLIIGDVDEDEKKIVDMIKVEKLEKNIQFTGYIFDFEKKIRYLAQGKIFIHPSYEENWAIVIGEAMAAGLPVYSYRLEELVDVWKDFPVWIPVGNYKIFSQKIIEGYKNKELLDSVSRNALRFIQGFDWKDIANQELKILLKP